MSNDEMPSEQHTHLAKDNSLDSIKTSGIERVEDQMRRRIHGDRAAANLSEKLFMQGYGGNLSKAYLKANMLAGEAVSNIRTVAAFCAEEKVLDLYARELVEPSKRSFTRGQIAGVFVTQVY